MSRQDVYKTCRQKITSQSGFTLIEVLAALLIFSISIIGLTHAGTQSAQTVFALEQKMLAGIVADNQLVLARARPLRRGTQTGEAQAKGRDYEWEVETQPTDVPGFFQLTVKVRLQTGGRTSEQVLVQRTAFSTGASNG